jgi:hypothetical protein
MPDYTIGIAERIASLPDSFATSNSVNRNYFQETSQSVVNVVNVAIAPPAPTALDPNPDTTYATATDGDSVETFGVQETPIVITLLATIEDAGALAEYLIRSVPAFWFSNLAISLNTLSEANKNIVANLEIGQQIAVTKTFPAGVVPQQVTEYLFVEGISHRVTPETHVVTIYTGPATTYLQWVLGNYTTTQTRTNLVPNPNLETTISNWTNIGAMSTVTRSATDGAYSGTSSMKVVRATNTGAADNTGAWLTLSTSTMIPALPSTQYSFSVYVRKISGTDPILFGSIAWANAAGGYLGEVLTSITTITSTTNWTRLTVTSTSPATTAFITPLIRENVAAGKSASTWQADAFLLEVASSALPYFDGTYKDPYTGYTLTFQAWNGTADASASTTVWGLNSSGTGSALGDSTYGLA